MTKHHINSVFKAFSPRPPPPPKKKKSVCFFLVSDNSCTLEFRGPFFFISKRLVNHTVGTKIVADFENCKLHCYYDHNCVSVNYHVSTKTCEFNKASYRWHNNEFKDENGYLYYGADVSHFFLNNCSPSPPDPPFPFSSSSSSASSSRQHHSFFLFLLLLLLLKIKSKISTDYITSPLIIQLFNSFISYFLFLF